MQQQPAVAAENKPVVAKKQSKKEKQQLAAQEKAKAMFALLGDEPVNPSAGVGELPAAKLVDHKKKEKKRKNEEGVAVKQEKFDEEKRKHDERSVIIDQSDGKTCAFPPIRICDDCEIRQEQLPSNEFVACTHTAHPKRDGYSRVDLKPSKRLRHDELRTAIHTDMMQKDPWYRVKVGAFVGAAAGVAAYNLAPTILASFYV